MIKILFICHGNICRSPMAEMVLKDMVRRNGIEDHFQIDSAATSREEIGNGIHYGTREKLAAEGIVCERHRARQMTRADYEYYDYLIGMDMANIRNMESICGVSGSKKISTLLSYAGKSRSIADPWYTGDFEATYRDVKEGCEAFLMFCCVNNGISITDNN